MVDKLLYRNTRHAIELGSMLFCEGEGEIWTVIGNRNLLVKVFHDWVTVPIETIEYQISHPVLPSCDGHQFAFPLEFVVNTSDDEVVGYVMKYFHNATNIKNVFLASYWLNKPFLIRVAKNISHALLDLHNANYFRRDFENTLVCSDGTIIVIDCDSL